MEEAIRSLMIKSSQTEVKFLINSKKFDLSRVFGSSSRNEDDAKIINLLNSTDTSKKHLVIIVVDSIMNFEDFILSVVHNVEESFIIMSYDFNPILAKKLIQKIWDLKKAPNINFMCPQENGVTLVTFYPFSDGNCGQISTLQVINKFTSSNWMYGNFFPTKLKNFHQCTLRLGVQPSFPAVERIQLNNGSSYIFTGSDIEIANEFSRKYNFTNMFIHNQWWGTIFENGTGDGTIGKLIIKDVDYICGWHFMNVFKSKFLDSTQPYFFVPFVVVVPPGAQYTSLENLVRCFSLSIWLGSASTCIFILILVALLNHFRTNQQKKIPYIAIVVILFGGSTTRIPHENALRMILMMFILFCLVMRTAYLTEMFNFLQSGTSRGVVESLSEMEQLKFSLYVPSFLEYFVPLKEINYDQKLIKVLKNTDEGYLRHLDSSFRGGYVEPLDSVIREYNKSSTPLNLLSEPLSTAPVAIYLQKNSFLTEMFSSTIQQMTEAGLVEYWIEQKWNSKMKSYSDAGAGPKVLSLKQLSAAFIICIGGLFAAFVVFVIEKLKCRKSKLN